MDVEHFVAQVIGINMPNSHKIATIGSHQGVFKHVAEMNEPWSPELTHDLRSNSMCGIVIREITETEVKIHGYVKIREFIHKLSQQENFISHTTCLNSGHFMGAEPGVTYV